MAATSKPPAGWRRPRRERVRAIRNRLRTIYGRPVNHPHGHPIAELVRTVLSQNTNDRNRDVAYERLRSALPTWVAVRDAPVEEVIEAIRPGGLALTKGPRIQEILRLLPAEGGEPTLDWLAAADRDDAIDFLTGLPGVGRKTAACVMIFALGRPEIPVDTHVYRVGGRLGLFPGSGLVRGRPRRDARDHRPRGRLRAAHQPDHPRPSRVPALAALRALRAAPDVPVVSRAEPVGFRPVSKSRFIWFGIFAAICLVALPFIALGKEGDESAATVEVAQRDQESKLTFVNNCGPCHTLAAAGTDGVVGPDLDQLLVPSGTNSPEQYEGIYARVLQAVTCGLGRPDAGRDRPRRGRRGRRLVRRRLRRADRQGPDGGHGDRPAGRRAHLSARRLGSPARACVAAGGRLGAPAHIC